MSNLFLKALKREVLQTPPIWMMRQAGRYHSHYQNLKKKYSFMDLCLQPDLAAEVALGPVADFDFDAAILFSDILFPLKALGMPLDYTDKGPQLGFQLNSENIQKFKSVPDAAQEMIFQKTALELTRNQLSKTKGLIGFVGGPWTLFVYAMEGTHSGHLSRAKTNWSLWDSFSSIITEFLKENIRLQFEGGADLVMILDTAAGELSPEVFQKKLQPGLAQLAKKFPGRLGYYSKGTSEAHFNSDWNQLPFGGQGFDHRHNLSKRLQESKGFVQGNFDQVLLQLETPEFTQFFQEYLRPLKDLSIEERRGWICGVGHGLLPQTREANVHQFVELIRKSFL